MIPDNVQKPFSWLPRDERLVKPKNLVFSANIRGICPLCGFKTQKPERGLEVILPDRTKVPVMVMSPEGASTGVVQKQAKLCPRCIKKGHRTFFLVLPSELIPWQTNPNITIDRAFECTECHNYRFSDRILGSLCTHKNHNRNVCRLCCRKVAKKALEKKSPENFETIEHRILYKAIRREPGQGPIRHNTVVADFNTAFNGMFHIPLTPQQTVFENLNWQWGNQATPTTQREPTPQINNTDLPLLDYDYLELNDEYDFDDEDPF